VHPILFNLGPFSLHSYGLAMALAFAAGILIAMHRAKTRGLGSQTALDLSVAILIFSLIGARATYVFTHLSEYREHPFDAISPIQHTGKIGIEGLVLLGGVIAAILTVFVFARRKKMPFLSLMDLLAPSTALGIAVGRIGCFFNGCCFGLPGTLPWCVHFPEGSSAAWVFPGQSVHPTQLYEVFYAFVIFIGLLIYDRAPRPAGRIVGWFLGLYGIGRFFNEQFRWYESEMVLLSDGFRLTFSQVISIGLILCGFFLVLRSYRKKAAA